MFLLDLAAHSKGRDKKCTENLEVHHRSCKSRGMLHSGMNLKYMFHLDNPCCKLQIIEPFLLSWGSLGKTEMSQKSTQSRLDHKRGRLYLKHRSRSLMGKKSGKFRLPSKEGNSILSHKTGSL